MGRFPSFFSWVILVCLVIGLGRPVVAQSNKPTRFWPDNVEFDPAIESPKQFFGFDVGFRHLTHAQVADYVRRLAETSDRISVEQYGRTHAGRPLLLLTITSPKNRERIAEIKTAHRRLSKPNADQVETDDLPAVINMGYGVHGDESSATNCATLVAYYLAAAQGTEVEGWLDDCVILLDPSLNPDGFNRFANWANRYRGRVLNADPLHAEHNQMWPPGRVNYYWFDLNRDWLPLVNPESRARMKWYHAWKPNIVLDFHEMGTNSTYFFQPGIPERTNPMTPARNQELTRLFSEFHGRELDRRGSLYYTRERYDDFYMGKGSTYPDLHGCVGILFEQASSRGHVQRNQDGLLRFSDTIANQFTTSLTSLRATSALRSELIEYKKGFYAEALELAADQPIKYYVFSSDHNRSRLIEFARILKRHDIACFWPKRDLENGDETLEAAFTLVVPAAQPEFRFLQSLLTRRTNFEENIFYDVSSWTLPLAFNLQQADFTKEIDQDLLVPFRFNDAIAADTFEIQPEDLAYMIDCRDDVGPWVLARLLAANVKVRVASKPVVLKNGEDESSQELSFGRGSLSVVLAKQKNKRNVIQRILNNAVAKGAIVSRVTSGLSESGPDLGSTNFSVIRKPEIAMLIGPGTSPYGAGEVWHLLDTKIGLPVTLIKKNSLGRARLDDYTALVLTDGALDDSQWAAVRGFANRGGTVIATGRMSVSVQGRLASQDDSNDASEESDVDSGEPEPIQKPFNMSSTERALQLISGAIFKTQIDTTHPLLYGFEGSTLPVFRNHARFLEPSKNPYANPVIYDSESPLMAGYCSDENVEKFKGGVSVVVHPSGRGRFVLMADNPNFRGFWAGTSRVFLNAVFYGDKVDP